MGIITSIATRIAAASGSALERLRFNSWTLGGRGAEIFEKSAEALELERINPLRGVDEWRLGQIFDDARDGIYADLAFLYNEIEGVEPALHTCCEARESASSECGWLVRTADAAKTRGFDQSLAEDQRDALLEEVGAVDDDLAELAGHLVSAFFRGAAHALPRWNQDGTLAGFRHLDLWNFAFDKQTGIWYWNADASRDEKTFQPIPPGELVTLAATRHVDHAALPIFIRAALGSKRYGVWLDRFGIPPVGVIMPPNAEKGEQAKYMALARKFARGGSGVLPNGTAVTYGTEARAVCPFQDFIRFQQQQIYMLGLGRVQSGDNQGENLGGNAAGVVEGGFRRIVRRDARRIARAINDAVTAKVLARRFPGKPVLAQFAWDTDVKRTSREVLEDAGLAKTAGLAIDIDQVQELTGYKLEKAPETPSPAPGFGLNAAVPGKTPFKNSANAFKNAPHDPGGKSPAPETPPAQNAFKGPSGEGAENALVDALEQLFEKSLTEAAAEAVKGEDGEVKNAVEECRTKDPAHCPTHGTPREPHDRGFQDRYGNGNPETLASNPTMNIERGKAVISHIMGKKAGFEPHAMFRRDVGWIGVDYGNPGSGKNFDGGHGVSHVIAKHPGAIDGVVDILQTGTAYKHDESRRKIYLIKGRTAVVLSKDRENRLLITDFENLSDTQLREYTSKGKYHVKGENE